MKAVFQVLAIVTLTFITGIPLGIWLVALGIKNRFAIVVAVALVLFVWVFVIFRLTGFGKSSQSYRYRDKRK